MARIRTVKPEFFRHAGLYDAERVTRLPLRLGFEGLWIAADREGRFKWEPRTLKLDCLPYDDLDFADVLDALEVHGFIEKYEVDGRTYGWIPSWHRHQHINQREAQSSIPPPSGKDTCTHVHAHGEGEGKGKEGSGGEEVDHADAPSPATLSTEWLPSDPNVMFAKSLGLTDQDIERAGRRFRDHYVGNARKSLDWDGLWRDWCHDDAKKLDRKPPGTTDKSSPPRHLEHRHGRVWIKVATDQWDAWSSHLRAQGKSPPPTGRDGGWYFKSEWPPDHVKSASSVPEIPATELAA